MLKSFINALMMTAYLVIVVGLILYFGFWRGYEKQLLMRASPDEMQHRLTPPRHIDVATMRLLGSARPGKLSHYIHHEETKPPGTIRICALGDSNTQGDEVGEQHDYPSYLQRQFRDRGIENVQVVNFGNGWYGFSQIYVMWDQVARKFDCDFVLLLPMDLWWQRDTTFNHSDDHYPDYLHARLILENDQLRLLAPIGDTAGERLHGYVRPIPYFYYLRYDRHPVSIVDAMLPDGKQIINPFYFDPHSPQEEMHELYRRLIQKVASDGTQVLVLFQGDNRKLYPQLIPLQPEGIGAAWVEKPSTFPYLTPAYHQSSWGNEIVAHAFFQMLTGQEPFPLRQAYTHDIAADATARPRPLYDYRRIWLSYEQGDRSAVFVAAGNQQQGVTELYMTHMHEHGVAALLALEKPGTSIADSCLIPLQKIPKNDEELALKSAAVGKSDISLGTVQQLQPDVAIYRIQLPIAHKDLCNASWLEDAGPDLKGTLILGGLKVALVYSNTIKANHGPLVIRELGEHQASAQHMTKQQLLTIHLQPEEGATLQRPFLQLLAGPLPDYFKLHCPPAHLLDLGTGNARIVLQRSDISSISCIAIVPSM
jgi:hypothetical protein